MLQPFLMSSIRSNVLPVVLSIYQTIRVLIYLPLSIYKQSMNLQLKRQSFINRIRISQQEDYFKKIRMTLLQQNSQPQTKHFTVHGQQQILESIEAYHRQRQFLNFEAINEYIVGYEGELRQQFICEVAQVVLENYRANGYAIASLAHILVRCEGKNAWLQAAKNLDEKIKCMIEENLTENGSKLNNAAAIAFLLFGLLNCIDNKQDFSFLPEYYPKFSNTIGFFNQAFLLMLQGCTHCQPLLPSIQFVSCLLAQEQVKCYTLDPLVLLVLCEFLQNYVCHRMTPDLCNLLFQWIGNRLVERKFSLTLKKNLIKIMTITIGYEFVGELINSQYFDMKIFWQVTNNAKFGTLDTKQEALNCLTTLIDKVNKERVKYLVEFGQIIEIFVYSLDLPIKEDLLSKILYALACIFNENKNYAKLAKCYGIEGQTARLSLSNVVKIAQFASLIQGYCNGV